MLKGTMLSVVLPMLALGSVLAPTASAGWFFHNRVEHHERPERNRSHRSSYGGHNTDRYTYYDDSYSHAGAGYGQNSHGGPGYYNSENRRYEAGHNYDNGRGDRGHARQH